MALTLEQFAVGTAPTAIFNIPPGTMNVFWYTTNTSVSTYLALSAAGATVTTSALQVTNSVAPVPLLGWATSRGGQIYAYATSPTTINVVMQTSQ